MNLYGGVFLCGSNWMANENNSAYSKLISSGYPPVVDMKGKKTHLSGKTLIVRRGVKPTENILGGK
jgi:hypothetical protein